MKFSKYFAFSIFATLSLITEAVAVVAAARKVKFGDPMEKELHSDTYNPNSTDRRIPLRIVAANSYDTVIWKVGPISTEPYRFVLNKVKEMPDFLSKYEIIIEPFDDYSMEPLAINGLVSSMLENPEAQNRLPLIVNPALTLKAAVTYQHFNVVGLCPGILGVLSDPDLYPNLLITQPQLRFYYEHLLPNFFNAIGWNRIAILGPNIDYNIEFQNVFINSMRRLNSQTEIVGPIATVYITGQLVEEEQIDAAVLKLKASDARVMLITLGPLALVACHLYKHGLYGPSYTYVIENAFAFRPTEMFKYPWCTEQMLDQVMESFFMYGQASANEFGLADFVDENGATGEMFNNYMETTIENLHTFNMYFFWSPIIYNFATAMVHMLNRTEAALQLRNETLADWFTNGKNNRERGQEFVDLVKEQFYSHEVLTQSGPLHWSQNKSPNFPSNDGFILGLLQIQRNKSSPSGFSNVPAFVLTYDEVDGTDKKRPLYTYLVENVKWRTRDGKPHRDRSLVIEQITSVIDVKVTSGLKGVCITLIVLMLLLSGYSYWKQVKTRQNVIKSYETAYFTLIHLLGLSLVAIFIVLIPGEYSSEMSKYCTVSLVCLITGQMLAISATVCRLEFFKSMLSWQKFGKHHRISRNSQLLAIGRWSIPQSGSQMSTGVESGTMAMKWKRQKAIFIAIALLLV